MITTKRVAEELGLAGAAALTAGAVAAMTLSTPGGLLLAALACATGLALLVGAIAWRAQPHRELAPRKDSDRMPDELNAF